MTSPVAATPTRPRDGWVVLGLAVSALSAAVSSWAGLHALALATGWHPWVAPLFPLTVDAFAATATKVWLSSATVSLQAKRFARTCAVTAIALSLIGNAVWHLIAAVLLPVTWVIVLTVGAIPPIVLGLVSHLAVLRTQQDQAVVPLAVPKPTAVRTEATPSTTKPQVFSVPARNEYGDEAALQAARTADAQHRQQYGRPISRDELRRQLKIGSHRASEVLRQLRAETETRTATIPQQPKP